MPRGSTGRLSIQHNCALPEESLERFLTLEGGLQSFSLDGTQYLLMPGSRSFHLRTIAAVPQRQVYSTVAPLLRLLVCLIVVLVPLAAAAVSVAVWKSTKPELYQMTHALAQLLQGKIFRQDSIKIPLREELEIVRYYLYLQGRRFADWLSYRCECEDEPLLDCLVPRLCVEPLVENAVVHGIEPKAAPGEIRVLVRREGEALLIEVNDDGVGFRAGSESGKRHSHVGLHNIERLVANLYGEGYGLTIESAENRGTRVLLRLPVEEG